MDPETQTGGLSPDTTRDDVAAVLADLAGGANQDDNTQDPAAETRDRDERGRFTARAPEQPTALNGAAQGRRGPGSPAPAPQGAEPAPEPAPAAAPSVAAPQFWKPEYGDWAKMPAQTQQAIAAREQQIQKFASDAGRYRKSWEPIEQALAAKAEDFKARGVQPQKYMTDLVAVESSLAKDMADSRADGAVYLDTLEWLAQQYYGKDLATLLDERDAGAAPAAPANGANGHANGYDPRKDPVVIAMAQRLQALESGMTAQEQARQAEIEAQQTARRTALRSEFGEFAKDKPLLAAELAAPEGTPRPMITIMQRLLASQQAATFAEAYEQASWLNPQARDALLNQQRQTANKRAREAAISPQASAPSAGATRMGSRESIEDSVRAALNDLQ